MNTQTNVFAVGAAQAQRQDRSQYKKLYQFNPDEDLAEYTLPVLSNQLTGKMAHNAVQKQAMAPIKSGDSQVSGQMDMEDFDFDMDGNPIPKGMPQYNEEEYDDEEEQEQPASNQDQDALTYHDFETIINTEGQTNNQVTELRKANFIRKNTASWHMVQAIKTGDQAISFFAKHGTNMPIKFLNCNRKPVPPAHYRPYDLIVIEDEKALDREYFTISAQGVVQVTNEKDKLKRANKQKKAPPPTEFLSLSDWMQQQTMFNVLTSMNFFKHYLISKVFGLWKGNVRYRTYIKTRQELSKSLIQARPDYQHAYMDINRILYDMQVKTTYYVFRGQKNYDIEDFNTDQVKHRNDTKTHYNEKVEEIISKKLTSLIQNITDSRTISDQEDLENTKIGQAAKNKSMVVQKQENALKNRVMKLAQQNYQSLGVFIRLIDYMVVETQVRINQEAAELILSEMEKNERKYSLQTVVGFDSQSDEGLSYTPTKMEINNHIENLLTAMQTVTEEVQRVINHNEFHQFIHGLITDSGPRFRTIVDESLHYKITRELIQERMNQSFAFIEENTKTFKLCHDINKFDIEFQFEKFRETADLEAVKEMFNQLAKWDIQINKNIKIETKFGLIVASGRKIKEKLQNRVKKEQDNLRQYLFDLADITNKEITKGIDSMKQTLQKPISNLNSYVEFVNKLKQSKEQMQKLQEQKKKFEDMKGVLGKYKVKDENAYQASSKIGNLQTKIDFIGDELNVVQQLVYAAEKTAEQMKDTNVEQLTSQVQQEQEKLVDLIEKIESETLMSKTTPHREALMELKKLETKFESSLEKIELYRSFEETLAQAQAPVPQIEQFQTKFNKRQKIWSNWDTFLNLRKNWYINNFREQDAELIVKTVAKYAKENLEMKMKMPKDEIDEVLEELTRDVKEVEAHKSLILALGSKAMQPRHWVKVFNVLDTTTPANLDVGITLRELIDDNQAMEHVEEIEDISGAAQGEMQIENTMKIVAERWEEINFAVIGYRDTKDRYIIAEVEDLITQLEDDTMTVSTMMGSKFVTEIKASVEQMEKKLVYLAYLIDEWLKFQRQWMYLENIFNAEDIIKQLPAEAKLFQMVDKQWKEHMARAKKQPKALDFASDYEVGVNLKKFQDNNKRFDEIQKCLEEYLSTKRAAFPRFYFLSNDEMLEILSQTRNPQAVQPHLIKCFDSMKKILFGEEKGSKSIHGMFSPENEYVKFTSIVKAEGGVEFWLTDIEKMMTQSLYDNTKTAVLTYPENGIERAEWLFHTNAQSILTVDMIKWTQGVEAAIYEIMKGKNSQALKEFLEFSDKQLKNMIKLVRGKLQFLQRQAMGALIVLDVHAIEVVRNMIAARVENINDFPWTSQLRYYWEPLTENDGAPYKGENTENDVFAKQTITRFRYGYEYLGNGPRLVITPLTDQCYMTLTGALHLNFGGNPAGPAGTGKTETTKDLAKALAVQCVVFNCSDGLDVNMMSRFFTGLSSGGAWSCFDEFNRIDIEVLSVIAQQILTIQSAIKARLPRFMFEGKEIPLNLRFGVFITMNPGYAGRTELPDNLKALFRPMAMMIPDYRLIAEISLYSEGFETAKELSRKMVKLYSLSSEQLSKQDHYDFGMRAVKSVLVMAGKLRRKDDTVPEDILLIRAMRDSNVPKFLEQDLPLFRGIIKDLFPTVVVPFIDYGKLEQSVRHELTIKNLQCKAEYITKIIQLLETMTVRHGNMLVGTTGTGKTTVAKILANALQALWKNGEIDDWYKPVKIDTLNPKSVSMGELFGEVSKLTNEWTEGIIPWLVKLAVTNLEDPKNAEQKRWIIFDGPVDAIWIENMNTVLDDNKMLCLNNGQRIKMPETCTMMFEVNDLKVASPATVSRCGMVYMEPEHLGWEVLVKTWQLNMADQIVQPYLDQIVTAIIPIFENLLRVIRKELKQVIESQDSNLISSCLNIIHIFLNKEKINLENRDKVPNPERTIWTYVSFSIIWSLGANLHDASRPKFGGFLSRQIKQHFPDFPDGDVYEYGINASMHTLQPWNAQIPQFHYNPQVNFFDILVPTNDTVKYKYLLNILTYAGYNTLFSGETGVGKSVIVKDFLMTSDERIDPAFVNFSGKTTCRNLQDAFEGNLEQKRKNLLAPKLMNSQKIFFIDDVNMPQLEKYFAQPPVELLRQTIDQGGFYDVKKLLFKHVASTKFIAACAPPGGGRNAVTPRLFRHFNMIWVPDLSQASMKTIFTAILKGNLDLKPGGGLSIFAEYIVKSSVEIYLKTINDFLPTPTKCHYTFNLRDLSKVVQGMLMCKNEDIENKEYLVYLYISETYRVFRDRLIDEKDRTKFNEMSHQIMDDHLSMEWNLEDFCNTIFGDFETNDRKYIKLSESNELMPRLDELLQMYNAEAESIMNLVFFEDCIQHLARIARILRQQRGNAMLVGVGGSGRSSMARLAASINSMTTFSIEITKSYRQKEWYEDIKKMLRKCGLEDETVQFLFSDTQIVNESFLEDINNLLNSGEIPNLFPIDEKVNICDELQDRARQVNKGNNRDEIYSYFVAMCRERLHIVLAFSPVGDQFRNRCRQFPSIINCCTIDWYNAWPAEALYSVAYRQYQEQEVNLGIQETKDQIAKASVFIHESVKEASEQYFNELRRRNYTTPTSYLDLIKTYIEMLGKQKVIVPNKMTRYKNGLTRLAETNVMVDDLKKKLISLMPVIEEKTKATQEMVVDLEKQTEDAAEIEKTTATEEAAAKKIFMEVSEIKNACEAVLSEAMPALKKALAALDTLQKNDISEMKNYGQPPEDLVLVMDAVCLLLGKKTGWAEAKQLMNNPGLFIETLQGYNKDTIPQSLIKKLKKYIDDPRFQPDLIAKKSQAGKSICMWVCAMDKYSEVKKIVEPKEAQLAKAQKELDIANGDLKGKQAKLQTVRNKIYQLQTNYKNSLQILEDLNTQKETTEVQLGRAEKLVNGLHEESIRWGVAIQQLEKQLNNLTGNMLICAGYISYVGTFTQQFRVRLLKSWQQHLTQSGIPYSFDFTIESQLGDPVVIRDWLIKGLPADPLSVSNGIIATTSKRWPLIIDPQSQGNKWIKNMEKQNNHKVIKLSNSKFLNIIESSIKLGFPVLLENVEEKLDPSLEPVLTKNIFKYQGQWVIKLGESKVPYNNDFKFVITTKLANPHYLPEICIKVALINFTVTPEGLEDQLLVEVVRNERPELEQQKDQLIVQLSDFKRQLKELEDKILKLVSEASDDILNDEELIITLDQSKETSIAINERMIEAEQTAKMIDENRENYRVVARRGSVLYFVVADLAAIDPMYQYSLEFFTKLFVMRLEKSEKSSDLQQRLQILIADVTRAFYFSICRGLFEKDKLLYSFLNASSILRRNADIDFDEWSFFLRGSSSDYSQVEQKIDYIEKSVFVNLCGIEDVHANFKNLVRSFEDLSDKVTWKSIMQSDEPHLIPMPPIYEDRLTQFQKMMLLKILRPGKMIFAIKNFVKAELGAKFIESPPFDLEGCLADSSNVTPIIFVLSPGADPIAYLNALAVKKGMGDRLHSISLGQGQGVKAEKLIQQAQQTGSWVCLQNCHLSATWMPELEKIHELSDGNLIHPEYRLWLTSMPSSVFPVPVLQGGLKLTNEPPKGLKANMTRSLTDIGEARYEGCSKSREYKKLVFALAYFHAAILERRKYGAIGWNIAYEWMNSDFNTSELNLRMYLDEQPETPYIALNYLIAQVNYGGRVTDDKDIRCIKAMLKNLYRSEIMQDGYKLSKLDTYYAPPEGTLADTLNYVSQLPLDEDPEVFGLHSNANIAFELKTVGYFMDTTLVMQPRAQGGKAAKTPEERVTDLCIQMGQNLPPNMDLSKGHPLTFAETAPGVINSLGVFIKQEIQRFNTLLSVIRVSLEQLAKAIEGTVVMSMELESMFAKFIDNKVPDNWSNPSIGYPCLKPLGSWMKDLIKRIDFVSSWLYKGNPLTYWIPAFFFPQGFITATMQTYARKNQVAIDALAFKTNVLPCNQDGVKEAPPTGIYMHGLYMQGARWDSNKKCVDDSHVGVPIVEFPVIWLEPVLDEELKLDRMFTCPLYKTSIRAGELSTTGHSTNFCMYLAIPTERDQDYWIRRGTALLCMTDD